MSKENRHRILLFHGTKRIKEASFLWLYQFFISCGKRFATSDRLALDATILFRNIARIHSLSINVKALQQPQFIIQTDKMSFRVKSPAWEVFYLCAFLFRKTISITVSQSQSLLLDLFLAPDQAPLNIQWTMIGSTLTLHWDPVVAMETESKVTGYLVGPSSDLSSVSRMTFSALAHFSASPFPLLQVLLKRHRYNDINTILTDKTTVELSLSANDNYLIQIKAMSEGGEGVGSEPIHIHKLSEFTVVFPFSFHFLF